VSRPPYRVALVGYGLAGSTFHAPVLTAVPQLRLAAVVTGNEERGERARRANPGVRVLASAAELWARAEDYDVAVVATPNRTHLPLALAALLAGLAVVVDKPLATTAAEGRQLLDLAAVTGNLLTVYQNRRWDGDALTVAALIADGALGRVLRFESRFDRWRPTPKPGWRESGSPAEAGGLLYDLGSHLVDQALHLFGPVTSVYAELARQRPTVEVDDDVFLAVTHANGVRSHLWASALAAQAGPRMRVLGDRAAYVKWGVDGQEAALRAGRGPAEPGWGVEPADRWGLLGVDDAVTAVPTRAGAYPEFYAQLAAALGGGGAAPVDPRDAVDGLEVLDAARRSARDGSVVTLGR
jgi:scyllo-inositol 2-dehydrogenase (NADP+)